MTNIYVIEPYGLSIVDVIDNYQSAIWRPSYSDIGDFELYLPATEKALNLLTKNNYLVREIDITTDEGGKATFKNVMMIKNINITTDVENGDYLTVTGKELKDILNRRIVWEEFVISTTSLVTIEHELQMLVALNAAEPMDSNRKIPFLEFDEIKGIRRDIQKQITYDKLGKAVVDVCNTYSLGWEIYLVYNDGFTDSEVSSGGRLVFNIYEGVDRSYNQTERPYVVFSDDFENLHNTTYELNTENYANVTLVAGEGEGWERIRTTVGEASGLNRYEVFTDAKDISSNAGSENEILYDDYVIMLQEKGRENLATASYTEGFSGEVLSDVTFKYGVDFFMGDIVTVINKYGISRNVRVLSAIESEDENGTKLVPQFNI